MASERDVQEVVAHCVGIVVYYENITSTAKTRASRLSEIRAMGSRARDLGLGEDRILREVEVELLARYGPEVGSGINGEFARAFRELIPAVTR